MEKHTKASLKRIVKELRQDGARFIGKHLNNDMYEDHYGNRHIINWEHGTLRYVNSLDVHHLLEERIK